MAARGYQNYHGKKNGRRMVLVVLLVLVLLLCVGYLALQDHIIYESDGSITLDLPFLRGGETAAQNLPDAADGETPSLHIVTSAASAAGQVPARQAGGTFSVAEQALYDLWEDDTPGPAAGVQGLVTEVKGETGVFYYQSDWAVQGAADERAVSRSGVADLLSEERDWSAVAAIHCFRDDYYAMDDMEGAGICQSTGYIWFGVDNSHWLEPSKQGTRAYLCAVAEECRDMGFDEILLRSFGYPTRGNLDKIDYSGMQMSKEESLEVFLRDLREALGEDVLLSVELTAEDVLSGHNSISGVELERILPLVDRLYVTGGGDRAALEAAVGPLLADRETSGFLVME